MVFHTYVLFSISLFDKILNIKLPRAEPQPMIAILLTPQHCSGLWKNKQGLNTNIIMKIVAFELKLCPVYKDPPLLLARSIIWWQFHV